jgi:hypothetical protein
MGAPAQDQALELAFCSDGCDRCPATALPSFLSGNDYNCQRLANFAKYWWEIGPLRVTDFPIFGSSSSF